jgi:hypothetical protein
MDSSKGVVLFCEVEPVIDLPPENWTSYK